MGDFTMGSKAARSTVLAGTALLLAISGAGPKKEKPAAVGPKADLPADLNLACLRVRAMDTLYELDLSPAQLKALRTAAAGCASDAARKPAPENAKLAGALKDFAAALLARGDDEKIAELRNKVTELSDDDDANLDDDVHPTPAARTRAVEASQRFNAAQVAAFLASHADQVADPAEAMVSLLAEVRETDDAAEADEQVRDQSEDLGWLVAGQDAKRAAAVTAQIGAWVKANKDAAPGAPLEESARKVVGSTPPMVVLTHWMENRTAELLSNPQLPQAIDAVLASQDTDH